MNTEDIPRDLPAHVIDELGQKNPYGIRYHRDEPHGWITESFQDLILWMQIHSARIFFDLSGSHLVWHFSGCRHAWPFVISGNLEKDLLLIWPAILEEGACEMKSGMLIIDAKE